MRSVCAMGRRKCVGLVVVTVLTALNIWMARYVIKPLNEARRKDDHTVAPHGRKLSDVLVISLDDVHPVQHLQEAAVMNEKTDTTIPEFFHSLSQRTKYNPHHHNQHSNGRQHGGSTNVTMFTENNYLNSPHDKVNNNINSPNNHNVLLETRNRKNESDRNGLTDHHVNDMGQNDLETLNTQELINIKHNLQLLKQLLWKLNSDSVTGRPVLTKTESPIQRSLGQDGFAVNLDTNLKIFDGQVYGGDALNKTTLNPSENFILDYSKNNIHPPIVAAPALPDGSNTNLLKKILSGANVDSRHVIIKENAGAVRNLLLQILHHLIKRQRFSKNKPQGQHLQVNPAPLDSNQQQNYYVPRDTKKIIVSEMIKNIMQHNFA